MNSGKADGAIRVISFTQIEFGSMTLVLEAIERAKVKKDYNRTMMQMKAFLKSMGKIGAVDNLPEDFNILSISRVLAVQSFPADVFFDVTVSEVIKNG